ncbi:hypothetical protein PVAND_016385 [Polypedilum vanderplanki]|uniref:Metalloendopeptidase n=1 Tax=Polypedilum vanderplanki TaxID=319348 RepID=A0A9J6BFA4_POLVA|nr:hypothetical protein PVAND_016385 [Polypedilum vanderplanki]
MKFLILTILISIISAIPFDDRIIFRDEDEEQVNDSAADLNFDQLRLLNDPSSKILKSLNDSKEFIRDEKELQKLENGQFYQGDIVLLPDQEEILNQPLPADNDNFPTRTGLISEYYRWPRNRDGKVIVPYEIGKEYSLYDRIRMYLAMFDIERYTCIHFKQRVGEEDYVHIKSGNGCSSNLGKVGGRQDISLKRNGCLSRGTIQHELIHALGYDHMHSHSDRDKYVTIVWNNIDRKAYNNFEKNDPRKFSNFGTDYDFYSVMHYNPTAFSSNGKRTIVPKIEKYRNVIGQRVGLSEGDAQRINNMYNCQ